MPVLHPMPLSRRAAAPAALFLAWAVSAAASPPPVRPAQPGSLPARPGLAAPVRTDLALERFEATEESGEVHLVALVRNVGSEPYAGGGVLLVERTTGGTVLKLPENDDLADLIAEPAPVEEVARKPLPPLGPAEAVELRFSTKGRAVYGARLLGDGPAPAGLPDLQPENNTRTLSLLKPGKIVLNNQLLQTFLGKALSEVQVRLDRDHSFVKVPGLLETSFTVPEFTHDLDLFGKRVRTFTYAIHDINTASQPDRPAVQVRLANRALLLRVRFETRGPEVVGSGLAPDLHARPLELRVTVPLAFDEQRQCLCYYAPRVKLRARWELDAPYGDRLTGFLGTINREVEERIERILKETKTKRRLEYELNAKIRSLLSGGRIVRAEMGAEEIVLHTEVPFTFGF